MVQPQDLERVARLRDVPDHVSAAGITRSGSRLHTIENASTFETPSWQTGPQTSWAKRRRLVIVAGLTATSVELARRLAPLNG
jgi:hypothetical protein